ncbi:MAG: DinB family protein [Acidobacteriota bacterium]|nr:DinB family protein [Acidobacteriota bacterium]
MKQIVLTAITYLACGMASAAEPQTANLIFDKQLTSMERELVPLVEAMPAGKFDFAPIDGTFQGVRTFGMQAKHVAYVMNEIASGLLGEKNPSVTAANENGPAELKSKEEILKYVKDAFAYTHKAFATLTNDNLLGQIDDPFGGKSKMTRLNAADIVMWHSFDHYGQMVVYARMNRVVPPASR